MTPLAKIENRLPGIVMAVGGRAVGPQGSSAVQRDGNPDKLGIEPCAAAVLQRVDCAFRATAGGEDIEMLCDRADSREQRNLFASHAVGSAAAIPVLVHPADSL